MQLNITPNLPPAHNDGAEAEYLQYFYHSDHASTGLSTGLGSASFVTDATGYVDQHIQYLPFGELFISQRNSTFDSRYKFTAKELDNETNYTYFGARYLDSDISIWLSVDPLADQRPWLSPYNYCQLNPIGRIDPTGALDDEWELVLRKDGSFNINWMSDKGGDEVQIINYVIPHESGAMESVGTSSISGSTFFVGPMALNYDGDFTYGASNVDLWADVPQKYQGHYTAWDLKLRYTYSQRGDQTQINNIRQQETQSLDRREMIWNWSDEYYRIVSKYGSNASLCIAAEYGFLPMPIDFTGSLNYSYSSLISRQSSFFNTVRGFNGSNNFKRIPITSSSPNPSSNPWIRFLQNNKGRYKGSDWLNKARNDYYKLK